MPDDILRRVPPQNLEAEQSVLGAILLQNAAVNDAIEILAIDDFYPERHKVIFAAMVSLSERSMPIDAITMTDTLRTAGKLEAIGGPSYIAELAACVPTAANVAHYARIVRELSMLRALASTATAIAADAFDRPPRVSEFLDASEQRIYEIAHKRAAESFSTPQDLLHTSLTEIQASYLGTAIPGMSTGLADFDRLTSGLNPEDLVIIAARPSQGKTALALNIASFAAGHEHSLPVAFFSLEMSKRQLMMRLLCSEARVDGARVRAGFVASGEFARLAAAAARLEQIPLYIDDTSGVSPLVIKAKCRRLAARQGLALVVVDYLQLMRPARRLDNRQAEISDISASLKALAKELKVPVVALSQLNRQAENRTDHRPVLADLRESGAIEQDADLIAFIYRDEVYDGASNDYGVAELIVAKQRNGPTDTVRLAYVRHFARFENLREEA